MIPEAFFPDPVVSQQCLNIDKQQLLTIYTFSDSQYMQYDSSIHTGIYVHHCHALRRNSKETVRTLFMDVLYGTEVCGRAYFCMCICIIASTVRIIA